MILDGVAIFLLSQAKTVSICQINYDVVYLFLDFQVAKDSSVEKLIVRMKSWYLEKDGECQSSP